MATRTSYVPPGTEWAEDEMGMSPAIRVGNLVWLSGVPVSPPKEGQSLEDAIDTSFSEIESTLEEAGLTWNDVVDLTTYHLDMEAQKGLFLKVKSRYITKKPYPSWTAIGVTRLWDESLVAEIKVVASDP